MKRKRSRDPAVVMTANAEVQTFEAAQIFTFTILLYSWQYNCSKKRLHFYRAENFAKTTDIPMSVSADTPTIVQRREDNYLHDWY